MNKIPSIVTLSFMITSLVMVQSCKDDKGSNPEFIANDQSFGGFEEWTVVASHSGPDPALGAAHSGNDETVTRTVYVKDDQDRIDGIFPTGTLIVKHSNNPNGTVDAITAMAKRGNNFNEGYGDWEFFVLESNGAITTGGGTQLRGAMLMDGACRNCHSQAAENDFIFSK